MTGLPNKPANRGASQGEESGGDDDAVIGRAFRLSLAIVVGALVLVGAVVYFTSRPPAEEPLRETAPLVPVAPPSVRLKAVPPSVPFRDITESAGIEFRHVNGATGDRLLPETMGGGAAFFDMEGDGDPDLLLVNSAEWPWTEDPAHPNALPALYRNDGTGRFEDVTRAVGLDFTVYGMGAAVTDYDGDGLPDVFFTTVGPNRLFRNLNGSTFEEVTDTAGVAGADDAWSTGAAFLDYDRDGDVDLFVANYVTWSREIDLDVDYQLAGIGRAYGPPMNYAGAHPVLYRNEGDGTFLDVSAEAGIHVNNPATGLAVGKSLGVHVADVDADGWPDILVANDTVQNFLFRNLGDGRFEEIGSICGFGFDNSGAATGAMGIDAAVYNGQRDVAVAVGNFANEMTSFYVAPQGLTAFTDEALVAGIGPASRRVLTFGLFFFDYDLDGRLDLFQANGHVENEIHVVQASQRHAQAAQLFWNGGLDAARPFLPVPDSSLGDLAQPMVGRGAAFADIDLDGDPDVVVCAVGGKPRLFRNDQITGHHWLRIRLEGRPPNQDALGAIVEVRDEDAYQSRSVSPFRSYLSQVELPLTFGLGAYTGAPDVKVIWPDGTREGWPSLEIDQGHLLKQGTGNPLAPTQ